MERAEEFMLVGGHRLSGVSGRNTTTATYECRDCGTRGNTTVFRVGIDVCTGRPESLNNLSVCPGGEGCRTHMDQTTAKWREWKASASMSKLEVPHYVCDAGKRADRAADHFLSYVNRSGMVITDWERVTGGEEALVARFEHVKGRYELWVGRTGMLTALRTEAAS